MGIKWIESGLFGHFCRVVKHIVLSGRVGDHHCRYRHGHDGQQTKNLEHHQSLEDVAEDERGVRISLLNLAEVDDGIPTTIARGPP